MAVISLIARFRRFIFHISKVKDPNLTQALICKQLEVREGKF